MRGGWGFWFGRKEAASSNLDQRETLGYLDHATEFETPALEYIYPTRTFNGA
jgi:hypothetical protein